MENASKHVSSKLRGTEVSRKNRETTRVKTNGLLENSFKSVVPWIGVGFRLPADDIILHSAQFFFLSAMPNFRADVSVGGSYFRAQPGFRPFPPPAGPFRALFPCACAPAC